MDNGSQKSAHAGGCLVRLFWMALGNLVLMLALVSIFQNHTPYALTSADVIYWITMLCLPAARYVDIRYFNGETADNRPATMADWRRYAISVVGIAIALWVGTHLLS